MPAIALGRVLSARNSDVHPQSPSFSSGFVLKARKMSIEKKTLKKHRKQLLKIIKSQNKVHKASKTLLNGSLQKMPYEEDKLQGGGSKKPPGGHVLKSQTFARRRSQSVPRHVGKRKKQDTQKCDWRDRFKVRKKYRPDRYQGKGASLRSTSVCRKVLKDQSVGKKKSCKKLEKVKKVKEEKIENENHDSGKKSDAGKTLQLDAGKTSQLDAGKQTSQSDAGKQTSQSDVVVKKSFLKKIEDKENCQKLSNIDVSLVKRKVVHATTPKKQKVVSATTPKNDKIEMKLKNDSSQVNGTPKVKYSSPRSIHASPKTPKPMKSPSISFERRSLSTSKIRPSSSQRKRAKKSTEHETKTNVDAVLRTQARIRQYKKASVSFVDEAAEQRKKKRQQFEDEKKKKELLRRQIYAKNNLARFAMLHQWNVQKREKELSNVSASVYAV